MEVSGRSSTPSPPGAPAPKPAAPAPVAPVSGSVQEIAELSAGIVMGGIRRALAQYRRVRAVVRGLNGGKTALLQHIEFIDEITAAVRHKRVRAEDADRFGVESLLGERDDVVAGDDAGFRKAVFTADFDL